MTHLVNSHVSGVPPFLRQKRRRLGFSSTPDNELDFVIGEPLQKKNRAGLSNAGMYCPGLVCSGTIECDILKSRLFSTDDLKTNNIDAKRITSVSFISETGQIGDFKSTTIDTIDLKVRNNAVVDNLLDAKDASITETLDAKNVVISDVLDVDEIKAETVDVNETLTALNVESKTADISTLESDSIILPTLTGETKAPLKFGNDSSLFTDSNGNLNISSGAVIPGNVSTGPLQVDQKLAVLNFTSPNYAVSITNTTQHLVDAGETSWGFSFVPQVDVKVTTALVDATMFPYPFSTGRGARIWDETGKILWTGIIDVGNGVSPVGGFFEEATTPIRLYAGLTYTYAMTFEGTTPMADFVYTGAQTISTSIVDDINPVYNAGPITLGMPTGTPPAGNAPNVTFGLSLIVNTAVSSLVVDGGGATFDGFITMNNGFYSLGNGQVDGAFTFTISTGGLLQLTDQPTMMRKTTTAQSITHDAFPWTKVELPSQTSSVGGISYSSNEFKLTTPGVYDINANISFASNAVGVRGLRWQDDTGELYGMMQVNASATTATMLNSSGLLLSNGSRSVWPEVFQTSGGSLDIGTPETLTCSVSMRY